MFRVDTSETMHSKEEQPERSSVHFGGVQLLTSGSHTFEIDGQAVELNGAYVDTRGRVCIPVIVYQMADGLVVYDGTLCFKATESGKVAGYCVPSSFSLTGEVVSR